jgi:hypothetical protein
MEVPSGAPIDMYTLAYSGGIHWRLDVFPTENGDFPWLYVKLPKGKAWHCCEGEEMSCEAMSNGDSSSWAAIL